MSTAAPEKKANAPEPLIPPDEKFWQRYSPHGEAPLSLAGSVSLHLLVGGGLILFGVYLAAFFFKDRSSVPVEPVRLKFEGGGGGKPTGSGTGKGVGTGPVEDVPGGTDETSNPTGQDEAPKRPALNDIEKQQVEQKFAKADVRLVGATESGKAFARLDESIRNKLADGLQPGKGEGGSGEGGGRGSGKGMGEGSGTGDGKTTLSKREKRMLRWHMRFTANNGPEYLGQLRGLGAILAFPVTGGENPQYKVVRELRPGGKLLDEDLSKIQRIYWIDDKPNSVHDILQALGVRLPALPGRFIAFMPEELEKKLYEMERSYVTKVLRMRQFDEEQIDETQFRVVFKKGKFQPELVSVSLRR